MRINCDTDCISRAKAGDRAAFAEIVSAFGNMVFTLVLKIVENREDAEDITQEIFVKVYQSIDKFRQDSEFSTWLYRIAYNTTLSEIRRRKMYFTEIEENTELREDDGAGEKIEKELKLEYLDKALKNLPPDENFLVTLYYINEQSTEEIGRICGLTTANVKVKLHRIRKKLAVEINKMIENDGR
jgi:RNA polymerase sigma-70 factor (ECF subfamily)